jgi:hypothetical protein
MTAEPIPDITLTVSSPIKGGDDDLSLGHDRRKSDRLPTSSGRPVTPVRSEKST